MTGYNTRRPTEEEERKHMYYLPRFRIHHHAQQKMQLFFIIRPWRMSYKSLKGYSNIEYDFPCGLYKTPQHTGLCLLQSNNENSAAPVPVYTEEWESRWTYCSSGSIMIITGCPELPFSLLLLLLSVVVKLLLFSRVFILKRGSNYYWLYCFHTHTDTERHDNGLLKINAGNCTQLHNDHSFGTSRHQSTNSLSSFSVSSVLL